MLESPAGPQYGGSLDALRSIELFLRTSRDPVIVEPGSDPIALRAGNFEVRACGAIVTIEAWDETHNLVRRVRRILAERRGRIEIEIERFGGRAGRLTLEDLAHPASRDASRRGARLKYRERFRLSLLRQFADWRLVELTTEPDLHHSLSPSYPRAFLRKGPAGFAAIGAGEDSLDQDGVLTFGLIWLDYLRQREVRLAIRGLAVFVPAGKERTTCHRVRYLDPASANCAVFVHHRDGSEDAVNPRDYTNFDTKVEPCRQPLVHARAELVEWVRRLASMEGVERRDQPDGSVSLGVCGVEFARAADSNLLFGLDQKHLATQARLGEIEALAEGLARMRRVSAPDSANPLYTRHPEAWLESQVRRNVEEIEARLLPRPIYGQVPQFAAGERGVLDLLAAERDGRLAVIEIKASQDIHLPLQALDYWMQVKWHLERGEFSGKGYFPGLEPRREPPSLLLVAPALEFHPTNEVVLRYFSPEVEAERIGVGIQWRQELKVMFRSSRGYARNSTPGQTGAYEFESLGDSR